jgi:hypothetical protein
MKTSILFLFFLVLLTPLNSNAQNAYRNYKWGMTVVEVAQNSNRLLAVNQVTRFSDVIFDGIARYKNYIVDGNVIRPINILGNMKNERQLYDENIAFYFEDTKLVAINIYHIDLNKNALSRDDVVGRYGEPLKYQWKNEADGSYNILELFANESNRYIVLQSTSQEIGKEEIKITLKHLTFVDRTWIEEKMAKYFAEYNNSRADSIKRLLD